MLSILPNNMANSIDKIKDQIRLVKENPQVINTITHPLPIVCMAAVKSDPYIIKSLYNRNIKLPLYAYYIAGLHDIELLNYVPIKYTNKVALKLLERNPNALLYCDTTYVDLDTLIKVLNKDNTLVKYYFMTSNSVHNIRQIIFSNYKHIKYLPDVYQTERFVDVLLHNLVLRNDDDIADDIINYAGPSIHNDFPNTFKPSFERRTWIIEKEKKAIHDKFIIYTANYDFDKLAKEKYKFIDITRLDDYGLFLIKNNKLTTVAFLKTINATTEGF